MKDRWIGLDIGGTKCAVLLAEVDRGIRVLDRVRFETETEKGFKPAWERLCAGIDGMLRQAGPGGVRGIGVSCGGPLDSRRGVILNPPNLPGWEDVPIVEMLRARFGLPAFLQNDANACALVEWRMGAGRGARDMVFLTMGTGMGAGVIANGALVCGAVDMAGEVGHLRLAADGPVGYGKAGSFEGFASGGGMDRQARAFTRRRLEAGDPPAWIREGADPEDVNVAMIARYAREGDADALSLMDAAGEKLGEGIALIADTLNPERVVVGSVFARCEDLLRAPMARALAREALPRTLEGLQVLPAQTGERLGDYAAVMVALEAMGVDPMAAGEAAGPRAQGRCAESGAGRLEYVARPNATPKPVRAVVFDFDGTISTLRHGWEGAMKPLMLEMISGGGPWDAALEAEVDAYIDASTGIQTIRQMQWLAERVHRDGANPDLPDDPWWYKDEYNRRLMQVVSRRVEAVRAEPGLREKYLMAGSVAFLEALRARGVRLYAASGTDHCDVVNEMEALGVRGLFDGVAGAPERQADCSKEKVIRDLLQREGLSGDEVCVIGDGKVEICLGRAAGMRTVGLASDEAALRGVNRVKRARLMAAGADVIVGDFLNQAALLSFLGLSGEACPRRALQLPFDGITTYSAQNRHNLVRIENLAVPGRDAPPRWDAEGFGTFVDRVRRAREEGRQLILSMGAHVIKCGLSRYLIELMKLGYITHLAGNGACSIHDFELACLGGTSEHVPTAIEDGSFGMWEETGGWMNEAVSEGAAAGLGYGESLGRYIDRHPERFPYREDCVLYNAWRLDIPATYHIALGTDIIHQHPACSFEAIGRASGVDFHRMCWSVAHLDGGVYMNFGSGVIGPEVFLKALSIARNLGYPTFDITTANFDLIDLGDYRRDLGYDDPQYYYRPRKNIVNRPVSRGGMGWHFCGDHRRTIPELYRRLTGGE